MLNNILIIKSLVYMSFLHYIVYFHPLHCICILLHYIVGIQFNIIILLLEYWIY